MGASLIRLSMNHSVLHSWPVEVAGSGCMGRTRVGLEVSDRVHRRARVPDDGMED